MNPSHQRNLPTKYRFEVSLVTFESPSIEEQSKGVSCLVRLVIDQRQIVRYRIQFAADMELRLDPPGGILQPGPVQKPICVLIHAHRCVELMVEEEFWDAARKLTPQDFPKMFAPEDTAEDSEPDQANRSRENWN